jgi:hypothetical protein
MDKPIEIDIKGNQTEILRGANFKDLSQPKWIGIVFENNLEIQT